MKINKSLMFDFKPELYDSSNENHFHWMLLELEYYGFIDKIILQPNPFKYSEKTTIKYFHGKNMKKAKQLKIDAGRQYTPDAYVEWNKKALNKIHYCIDNIKGKRIVVKKDLSVIPFFSNKSSHGDFYYSYFEVKPKFDKFNMTRLAQNIISFIYDKYDVRINLIICEDIFKRFFMPCRYFYTDKNKKRQRKIKFEKISIDEFLKNTM